MKHFNIPPQVYSFCFHCAASSHDFTKSLRLEVHSLNGVHCNTLPSNFKDRNIKPPYLKAVKLTNSK